MTKFTEPYGNRAYVVLDSYALPDPNDNRAALAFDELGLVTKMAVKEGPPTLSDKSVPSYDRCVKGVTSWNGR